MESLSVDQIQELQKFVEIRNGIFDFSTYSFSIQKRLEFTQFVELIKYAGIKATCQELIEIEKEKSRVGFGQYKGMLYEELPDSYLIWLKSNYHVYDKDKIEKEFKKRKL